MKAAKIAGIALAAALALLLVFFLAGLFQRLLIAGTRMVQDMGDTVIITDDEEVGGKTAPAWTEAPVATWPPGDDPSWGEEMPQVPVDKTADELAEETENQ